MFTGIVADPQRVIADLVTGALPGKAMATVPVSRLAHDVRDDFSKPQGRAAGRVFLEPVMAFDDFDIGAFRASSGGADVPAAAGASTEVAAGAGSPPSAAAAFAASAIEIAPCAASGPGVSTVPAVFTGAASGSGVFGTLAVFIGAAAAVFTGAGAAVSSRGRAASAGFRVAAAYALSLARSAR